MLKEWSKVASKVKRFIFGRGIRKIIVGSQDECTSATSSIWLNFYSKYLPFICNCFFLLVGRKIWQYHCHYRASEKIGTQQNKQRKLWSKQKAAVRRRGGGENDEVDDDLIITQIDTHSDQKWQKHHQISRQSSSVVNKRGNKPQQEKKLKILITYALIANYYCYT